MTYRRSLCSGHPESFVGETIMKYSWTRVQAFRLPPIKKKYRDIWEKIRRETVRLDQLCAIHRGLWTGTLYVYVVNEETISEYNIEKAALRPILRGKDIKPFGFRWAGYYVLYATEAYIPDFPKRFPNAMRWLEKYKLILERRAAVFAWGRRWWELEDPLDPKVFEVSKILGPLFARFQSFALDLNAQYYALDSSVIIRKWLCVEEQMHYAENWKKTNNHSLNVDEFIEKGRQAWRSIDSDLDSLYYILALLNSEVLEFFFKLFSPRLVKRTRKPKKGRWYSYMPPYLNILPIKIADKQTILDVIRQTKTIVEETNKLLSLDQSSDEKEKKQLESEIGFLLSELNEVIFDIYSIDDIERVAIQNFVYKKR